MDAQLAVDKILETENLTDGLEDDAANWLLDWGTEHVKPLVEGIKDDDAAGDKVNEVMAVMRQLNKLAADRGTLGAEPLTADVHAFLDLYSKAFGTAHQPADDEIGQTVSALKDKSPQEAMEAILALAEPIPAAPAQSASPEPARPVLPDEMVKPAQSKPSKPALPALSNKNAKSKHSKPSKPSSASHDPA